MEVHDAKPKFQFSPEAKPFIPKNFSVDAKPFVPRSFVPINYISAGSSVNNVSLSAAAPEFYPKTQTHITRIEEITTGQAVDVVADIQWAIQVLTTNPANFDDVMSSLTALPLLAENRIDDIVLDAIVDEIFNNSVNVKNFRYTGARMCGHLMAHLQPSFGVRFQTFLINRCQRERDFLRNALSIDNLQRLIGFTLFLGELVVNTKDVVSGGIITDLPEYIMLLLYWLIHMLSDASAVCIVQVLKLTGPVLEQYASGMQDMCVRINGVAFDPRTPPHIRMMFMNVMQLRSSNWGRNITEPATSTTQPQQHQPYVTYADGSSGSSEPYFFDENTLCDDFDNMSNFTDSDGGASPTAGLPAEYWAGDEMMDPEMAAAFEVFLAESSPASNSAANSKSTNCNGSASAPMHNQP